MSRNEIKRGEIYYITFAPVVGSEQHGGRPGIVVSNNMNNAHSNTIEVVYLTTQPMGAGEGRLLHADGFYLHGQLLAALPGKITE